MSGGERSDGVVFHLDEDGSDKHEAFVRNVANLLDYLEEDATIELVAHGPGIGICLADSPQAEAVRALVERGVLVAACENTLRARSIGLDQLAVGVTTVPAGIGELVRRQRQGWAYVRP